MRSWIRITIALQSFSDNFQSFSDNYGYSLILPQTWQVVTSHRVAGIWNLKPQGWTLCIQLQYNLLVSFSLEGIVLLIYNFVAPCTGHMENISALNYVDLPIVGLFHYTLSEKSQSLLPPSVSPEKSVFVWCWAHHGRCEISKTSFCLRVWIELSAKVAWAVFLEMTGSFGSLFFFHKKCTAYVQF